MPMTDKATITTKTQQLLELTNAFSDAYLDDDYKRLCEKLIRKMSRKRVIPFMSGKPETWAAGVVHALGMINFLFDRSFAPYVSSADIATFFGVGQSTVQQKSKTIRDMFKMRYYDLEWMTEYMASRNPLARLIMVDGIPVDAGTLPPEVQDALREAGLIR
jgi:hypothetical protein